LLAKGFRTLDFWKAEEMFLRRSIIAIFRSLGQSGSFKKLLNVGGVVLS
jgi:hypothetical protein